MGYWSQNEEGEFLIRESNLIWGDAPADVMGTAIREIIRLFKRDHNRPPTEAEVKAGLLFSLQVALEEEV